MHDPTSVSAQVHSHEGNRTTDISEDGGSSAYEQAGSSSAAPASKLHMLGVNRESSLMGDVRGWIAYVQGSNAGTSSDRTSDGATPATSSSVTVHRSTARTPGSGTPYPSEQVAAAAFMAPVFGGSPDSGTETNLGRSCQLSFRKLVIGSIVICVLAAGFCMWCIMLHASQQIRNQGSEICDHVCDVNDIDTIPCEQQALTLQLINDNVTTARYMELLRTVSSMVEEFVKTPANNAVDAMLGSMAVKGQIRPGWNGQGEQGRKWLAFRSWIELAEQWGIAIGQGVTAQPVHQGGQSTRGGFGSRRAADALAATFKTGQLAGTLMSRSVVNCSIGGPAKMMCGECSGPCEVLIVTSYEAPAGANGETTQDVWQVDTATGEVAQRLGSMTTPYLGENSSLQVQVDIEARALSSPTGPSSWPAQRAWSKVHLFEANNRYGYLKLSWTAPIAYCGDYSCFQGAVAADVVLRQVSADCHSEWLKLQQILSSSAYGFAIGLGNSSVFIVHHVAELFPDQQGLLIGNSDEIANQSQVSSNWQTSDDIGRKLISATDSDSLMVRRTSQALLKRFGAWNSSDLQLQQIFNFTAANNSKPCDSPLLNAAADIGCWQVGTLSVELDVFTRWLVVTVLPSGAFNKRVKESEMLIRTMVNQQEDDRQNAMVSAKVTFLTVFVIIISASTVVGGVLGCSVSHGLHRLSELMQLIGHLDFARESAGLDYLKSGCRASIKDIRELQNAFCRLLVGIEAFTRFVPESVVSGIVQGNHGATRLHVKHCEVTCMFVSIRDFANLSETLSENELLRILRQYHNTMTAVVERHSGSVAEILDDGLLVYWNAPDSVSNHPVKACLAALAQVFALDALNDDLEDEGLPKLGLQIGFHTGMVLSGNIGSDMKLKFGCMGDAVNLSSRLAGMCKYFGVSVVCSGSIRSLLAETGILFRELASVKVKGKQEPTTLYEVVGRDFSCFRSEVGHRPTRVSFGTEFSRATYDSCKTVSSRSSAILSRIFNWAPSSLRGRSPSILIGRRRAEAEAGRRSPTVQESHCDSQAGASPTGSRSLSRAPSQDAVDGAGCCSTGTAAVNRMDDLSGFGFEDALGTKSEGEDGVRSPARSVRSNGKRLPSRAVSRRSLQLPSIARNSFFSSRNGGLPVLLGIGTPARSECDMQEVTQEEREFVQLYEQTLHAFQKAEFLKTKELADQLVEQRPGDKASVRLHERANMYVNDDGTAVVLQPAELEAWTGVETMTNK